MPLNQVAFSLSVKHHTTKYTILSHTIQSCPEGYPVMEQYCESTVDDKPLTKSFARDDSVVEDAAAKPSTVDNSMVASTNTTTTSSELNRGDQSNSQQHQVVSRPGSESQLRQQLSGSQRETISSRSASSPSSSAGSATVGSPRTRS
ncbi:hypothetical protein K431DRAFT_308135 [Polychaeton citri CBS 116435]|uniref:Uncharacterized protein n=1 Tax=Polychaeton citri CBS 116435 TaxID=1314669 RepID=A0A9P4PW28_9PEZI|nr:hypothetical protein K431DRAFT_308135 [Polychaeton citri CBS 116435]